MEKIFDVIKKNVVHAIHCELPTLAFIQHRLIESFPSTSFRYAKNMVTDVTNKDDPKRNRDNRT